MHDYFSNQDHESLSLKKYSHDFDIILGLKNQVELAPLQVVEPENLISKQGAI